MVYDAQQQHNITLKRGVTCDVSGLDNLCCGLGAIYFEQARTGKNPFNLSDVKYGFDYTTGYIFGFDGATAHNHPTRTERFKQGFEDGLLCATKLIDGVVPCATT